MPAPSARDTPPPSYNSLNFALRIPVARRNSSNRVRRLQITLVVGNWIGIIAFIVSSVVICVPVLSDDLSYPLKTTIRILGYILMGVVAFGMLFLNCVIRRTIINELIRLEERQRRRVSSIATGRQDLPPYPPGFLPIAEGQPGAYIGPYGAPKDGPLGLPDYDTAVAQSPPSYDATSGQQPLTGATVINADAPTTSTNEAFVGEQSSGPASHPSENGRF